MEGGCWSSSCPRPTCVGKLGVFDAYHGDVTLLKVSWTCRGTLAKACCCSRARIVTNRRCVHKCDEVSPPNKQVSKACLLRSA